MIIHVNNRGTIVASHHPNIGRLDVSSGRWHSIGIGIGMDIGLKHCCRCRRCRSIHQQELLFRLNKRIDGQLVWCKTCVRSMNPVQLNHVSTSIHTITFHSTTTTTINNTTTVVVDSSCRHDNTWWRDWRDIG